MGKSKIKRRRFRISTTIIWTIFIAVVVLCLVIDSHSQRVNNEVIRILIEDKLNKKDSELTKADYLKITELDLSETAVTDLRLIKEFTNLQILDLSEAPVELYNYTPKWRIILARWGILKHKKSRKKIDLSSLKYLKNLRILNLNRASFKNIKSISNLKNLELLILADTEISNINFLPGITSLQTLIMDNTNISDIQPLKYLTNLKELHVSYSKVSDLDSLKNLTQLQEINIRRNQINNLEPLRNLANLEELDLSENQVSDIEPLKNLKKLEILHLGETPVLNLDALKDLNKLRILSIWSTQVYDLEPLKNLTKLQRLDASNCVNITTEQIEDLKKALPELRIHK